jgi:hypothetical protein
MLLDTELSLLIAVYIDLFDFSALTIWFVFICVPLDMLKGDGDIGIVMN